jgi:hypothetical protein
VPGMVCDGSKLRLQASVEDGQEEEEDGVLGRYFNPKSYSRDWYGFRSSARKT